MIAVKASSSSSTASSNSMPPLSAQLQDTHQQKASLNNEYSTFGSSSGGAQEELLPNKISSSEDACMPLTVFPASSSYAKDEQPIIAAPLSKHTSPTSAMEIPSANTTSSREEFSLSDDDVDDDGSEGSFSLGGLMQDGDDADPTSSDGESQNGSCRNADEDSSLHGSISDIQNKTPTSRSTTASRRRQRAGEARQGKGWENLSPCTVFSGHDSCNPFDMSSRSLLDDCDFLADDSDDEINDQDDQDFQGDYTARLRARREPVRFSAGKVLANRGDAILPGSASRQVTPMSRITEHTRESSAYGSYSDLSGRNSFASTSTDGIPNLSVSQRRSSAASARIRGFEFSPSPHRSNASPRRRFDILNIEDIQALKLSDDEAMR